MKYVPPMMSLAQAKDVFHVASDHARWGREFEYRKVCNLGTLVCLISSFGSRASQPASNALPAAHELFGIVT